VCYADVKPANFLLKDRFPTPAASSLRTQQPCRQLPPDVRVIDFGCAQRVTEGTKLQKRTGAPRTSCFAEVGPKQRTPRGRLGLGRLLRRSIMLVASVWRGSTKALPLQHFSIRVA
jgi:hypothetical protein